MLLCRILTKRFTNIFLRIHSEKFKEGAEQNQYYRVINSKISFDLIMLMFLFVPNINCKMNFSECPLPVILVLLIILSEGMKIQ